MKIESKAVLLQGDKMLRKLLVILFVGSLFGCATVRHQPISPEDSESLAGKTLQTSLYEKSGFSAMTASSGMFGMIGALSAIKTGNEIIEKNIPKMHRHMINW